MDPQTETLTAPGREKQTRQSRFLLAAASVVLLLFVTFLVAELYLSRQDALAQAERQAMNTAHLLERHTESALSKVDLVLGHFVSNRRVPLDKRLSLQEIAEVEKALASSLKSIPEAQSLRVIDAQGFVRFDAGGFRSQESISDRAYFRAHVENPNSGLVVSEPLFARFTANWVITLSRRLEDSQGRFLGIVMAGVSSEYFTETYRALSLGQGVVGLYDTSERMVARYPRADHLMGKSLGATGVAGPSLMAVGQQGVFVRASRVDMVTRIHAFRKVGNYPLLVLAAVSRDEALAPWTQKAWTYGIASALMACTVLLLMVGLKQEMASRWQFAQMKADFMGRLGHDIRTALNVISGALYLLQREGTLPRHRVHLDRIDRSAQHLLVLIDDIIDLARIESGRFVLNQEEFLLAEMMTEVRHILGPRAEARNLALHLDVPGQALKLQGDRRRLVQALVNYTSNAIRHSEHGDIHVRVFIEQELSDRVRLRFEVEDQGPGLMPDQVSDLFSAFEQAESARPRLSSGSGLGLAINRHLAAQMSGEVGVSSQFGLGSIFWMTAELRKVDLNSPVGVVIGLDARTVLRERFPGLHILIVEDEPAGNELLCQILTDAGLVAHGASSALAALDLMACHAYDLILMDLELPDMPGITLAARIRQQAGYAVTPIIPVTANVSAYHRDQCRAAGMMGFVSKPVTTGDLLEVVLAVLREH